MKGSKHDRSLARNKDVRAEIALLERAGWVNTGDDSRGHPVLEHPDAAEPLTLPCTPKSRHWRRQKRHLAARLLGIHTDQLEERMGVARGHRKGGKPRPLSERPKKASIVAASTTNGGPPRVTGPLPPASELRRERHERELHVNGAIDAGADEAVVARLQAKLEATNRSYIEACRRERQAA